MLRTDFLNPIFVRDVRIMVRNRAILCCGGLNLGLLCYTVLSRFPALVANQSNGRVLFSDILLTEYLFGLLFAPLWTVSSIIRDEIVEELFRLTPVTAKEYIRGKVQAAGLFLFMLYGIMFPFVAVAYLLRGVDVRDVFVVPPLLFLTTLVACYWTAAFFYRVESVRQLFELLGTVLFSFIIGGVFCFAVFFWPLGYLDMIATKETTSPFAFAVAILIVLSPMFCFAHVLTFFCDGDRPDTRQRCYNYLLFTVFFSIFSVVAMMICTVW